MVLMIKVKAYLVLMIKVKRYVLCFDVLVKGDFSGFDDLGKGLRPVSVKVSLSSLFVPRHGMGLLMIPTKVYLNHNRCKQSVLMFW